MKNQNINLYILKASGRLTPYIEDIKKVFKDSLNKISEKIPVSNIDIVVCDDKDKVIPESGITGYTPNSNLIFISLDPGSPSFSKLIGDEFNRTLAHEMHHCMRWRRPGYGKTLLEVLITEGLADHFDLEIYGGNPHPWSVALDKDQTERLMERAKDEFNNKEYDHTAWFFGSKDKNIPRWTGYALGFNLVAEYLKKNPDKKPSQLHALEAGEFVK